jgi:hypothetical protein
MPADYLSRLSGTENNISAFNPLQPNLFELQKEDSKLKIISKAVRLDLWPASLKNKDCKYLQGLQS